MGWFDRPKKTQAPALLSADPLGRLFEAHVGTAIEMNFAREVLFAAHGGASQIDLDAGELVLRDGTRVKIQAVGLEDRSLGEFLWAWAAPDDALPAEMRRVAERLRGAGSAIKVPELTKNSITLYRLPAEVAAVIAIGVAGAGGYDSIPIKGGVLWFAIDANAARPSKEKPTAERIAKTMNAMTSLLELFRFDVLPLPILQRTD